MSASRSARSRWAIRAAVLVGLYSLTSAWARTVSDGMIYYPRYGSFRQPVGGIRIPGPNGNHFSALFLPNPAAHYTLWYFHGNAEDLGDIEPRLHQLRDLGFSVFAVDYPGYGLSSGLPSEPGIYEANRIALDYLREKHGIMPASIIAYGRSLGGGPAVELAAKEPLAGLILESAFMSAFRVMTRWRLLPFDKFENLRKIPNVRCPVLLIHGREDGVVPFHHGEKLLAATRSRKEHLWVELAGHNDVESVAGDAYWTALRKFAASLDGGARIGGP